MIFAGKFFSKRDTWRRRNPALTGPLAFESARRGIFKKGILPAAAVAVAAVLPLGQAAWAQGCVMCYTSASSLNPHAAHELDKAILVLGIPPVLFFAGLFTFIYRRSRTWRTSAAEDLARERDSEAFAHGPSGTRV